MFGVQACAGRSVRMPHLCFHHQMHRYTHAQLLTLRVGCGSVAGQLRVGASSSTGRSLRRMHHCDHHCNESFWPGRCLRMIGHADFRLATTSSLCRHPPDRTCSTTTCSRWSRSWASHGPSPTLRPGGLCSSRAAAAPADGRSPGSGTAPTARPARSSCQPADPCASATPLQRLLGQRRQADHPGPCVLQAAPPARHPGPVRAHLQPLRVRDGHSWEGGCGCHCVLRRRAEEDVRQKGQACYAGGHDHVSSLLLHTRDASALRPASPPRPCSNLPLANRATIIPWLYSAIDLGSTPGNYERYDKMTALEVRRAVAGGLPRLLACLPAGPPTWTHACMHASMSRHVRASTCSSLKAAGLLLSRVPSRGSTAPRPPLPRQLPFPADVPFVRGDAARVRTIPQADSARRPVCSSRGALRRCGEPAAVGRGSGWGGVG